MIDSLTIIYLLLYCCNSLCLNLLGTTLLELQQQVSSSVSEVSWIFVTQSIGVSLGSAVGGPLYDQPVFKSSKPAHAMLVLWLIATTISTLLIPFCTTILLLNVMTLLQGVCTGFARMGANCLLLRRQGENSAPYMQSLHFLGGVGGWIAPLLAKSLLGNEEMLFYTYIISSFTLIPIVLWIMIHITTTTSDNNNKDTDGVEMTSKQPPDEDDNDEQQPSPPPPQQQCNFPLYLVLISLLLFFENGARAVLQGYLVAYGRKSTLNLTAAQSLLLNATYSGAFAIGRLISIPISIFLKPGSLLMIDVFGSAVASIILLLYPNESYALIRLSAALFGLSIASIFPTSILFATKMATNDTSRNHQGRLLSILMITASIGNIVLPKIVGNGFDDAENGITIMIWTLFISCCISSIIMIVLWVMERNIHKKDL